MIRNPILPNWIHLTDEVEDYSHRLIKKHREICSYLAVGISGQLEAPRQEEVGDELDRLGMLTRNYFISIFIKKNSFKRFLHPR